MNALSVTALVYGLIGAAMFEMSRWVGLKTQSRLPRYMYKLHFWLLTVVQIALGGLVAGFFSRGGAIDALLVGLAGPAVISRLGAVGAGRMHLAGEEGPREEASAQDWFRG
jgi:uncharacterized membrane protein